MTDEKIIECENPSASFEEFKEDREDTNRKIVSGVIGWSVSLAFHCFILLLLTSLFLYKIFERERPPIVLSPFVIDRIEVEQEPLEERKIIEVDITIVSEEVSEVVSNLEFDEVVEDTTEDILDMSEIKGKDNALSDIEVGGLNNFMSMGVGGGGSGAFGREAGGSRKKLISGYGPNARRASSSIDAALRWLLRHQSPDGSWDSDDYWQNCTDALKCEPGQNVSGADEALTGYALLCFLGAGYDHMTPNKYRKIVSSGIDWLLSQQRNGLIGQRNYEHPIATMALAEAYAMSLDSRLREPVQKAIEIILQRQAIGSDNYPLGWDYNRANASRIDSSVSGWAVMSLKAASAGGFNIGNGLSGSKKWLEETWKSTNSNWQLIDRYSTSKFPYTWNSIEKSFERDNLSFVGVLCGVFLGLKSGDVMLESMMNDVDDRWYLNNAYRSNSYVLYYASLASFQIGGKTWADNWGNSQTGYIPWLISTQYVGNGCFDGTWIHENERWHGADTSPVLLHVYKTLAMEVAIRYEIVNK
jgi:hypothetical protein